MAPDVDTFTCPCPMSHSPFYTYSFPLNSLNNILIRELSRPKVIKYLKIKIRLKQLSHVKIQIKYYKNTKKNRNFRIHPQFLRYCYYIVRRYTDRKQNGLLLTKHIETSTFRCHSHVFFCTHKPQSEISLRTTLKINRKVQLQKKIIT